jgi:hypothetical protein
MNSKRTANNIYIGVITALGAAVIAWSIINVIQNRVSYQWLILAYLTVLTGAFTIRIPRVNSKFSVSDTFIFINTILFGIAAGVLTAALDGFVGSMRSVNASKRKQTIPFNTSLLGLSVFSAGEVFFKMLGHGPLSAGPSFSIPDIAMPLALSALVYYLCNSVFVAAMLSLDGGGNALRMWRQSLFTTFGVTLAGVAVGGLLALCVRSITPVTLLVVVPILVTIYFVNMIYLRSGHNATTSADLSPLSVVHRPAYRRFHYFMVALGLGFVALLLQNVLSEKIGHMWLVVAALAALGGFITVKIPGAEIKFTLADIFVFANTILFGPVVGGITAALDGLAGSMRCKTSKRRWEFTLFNVAAMALSAYVAGSLFFRALGHGPAFQNQAIKLGDVFLPALLLAVSYYLLNTMGVAIIVALQAQKNVMRVWQENMLWGMTTDVACALFAVFVSAAILAMTPMAAIAILLSLAIVHMSLKNSVRKANLSA